MKMNFESVTERDMDLLLMRKFACDKIFLNVFLKEIGYDAENVSVDTVSHSVSTEDGESDIVVTLDIEDGRKIALLIEDKTNAPAMDNQALRYGRRGDKAKKRGEYDEYHIFIVAPQKYLNGNSEAQNYPHKISYEEIQKSLTEAYDTALFAKALDVSKHGYVTVYNKQVTDFWDKIYDFADLYYPGIFKIQGKKGLARSGDPGQWITISCNNQFSVQIKSDRGYVDLEIRGYADKFEQFSKDNNELIDANRLYVRAASKSLAIRRYVECIDFTQPFDSQEEALRIAFTAAKELQGLIKDIKVR